MADRRVPSINNLLCLDSPAPAGACTAEFERKFIDGTFGQLSKPGGVA